MLYDDLDFAGNFRLSFQLPVTSDVLKMTIGNQGREFISLTEKYGHTFIYHYADTDIISIYTTGSIDSLMDTYNDILKIATKKIVHGLNLGRVWTKVDRTFLNNFINQEFPEFEICWIESNSDEYIIPNESYYYKPSSETSLTYEKKYVLKETGETIFYDNKPWGTNLDYSLFKSKSIEKPKQQKTTTLVYRPVKKNSIVDSPKSVTTYAMAAKTPITPEKLGWGDEEYWG